MLGHRIISVALMVLLEPDALANQENVEAIASNVPIFVTFLMLVVVAPLIEEWMFRGLIMFRDDHNEPTWLATIISFILFGGMHLSEAGLFDQLTSEYGEGFPEDAAQYAIENVDADYNYNALRSAESYSDTMNMSKQGIYDQLVSEYGEQFTADQAQYAIDTIDADWNENALQSAISYRETMDMSNEAIREQLTSSYGEQFTQEQADYAISNLD